MKEDKLDKDIAASLKKKLAEASVPYELGAWEGFQKKRALRKRREITYWASGIAASLLLLAVGLNSINVLKKENANPAEIQLAENAEKLPADSEEDPRIQDAGETDESEAKNENTLEKEPKTNISNSKKLAEDVEVSKQLAEATDKKTLAVLPKPLEGTSKQGNNQVSKKNPVTPLEKVVKQVEEKTSIQQPSLIAKTEEVNSAEKSTQEKVAIAAAEEAAVIAADPTTPVSPSEKQQFVAESDFPEIEKEKSSVGLGMGVSPGFGAIQNDNQIASTQTIGLGMLVDINLPGKFTLGSGVGFNYLSQNAEQQSTVMAFGNSYPQTEKLEVRQMQVEVPVFIKYPLTKNNSISLQAGFSNFYAINESASQENSYDRQVASYSVNSDGLSSVSLTKQTVNSSSALESPTSKFYPFASMNFGVNLRVLETKGATYMIMPFYNYQLKQVSVYGDTFGLFGASFKVNFGGSR